MNGNPCFKWTPLRRCACCSFPEMSFQNSKRIKDGGEIFLLSLFLKSRTNIVGKLLLFALAGRPRRHAIPERSGDRHTKEGGHRILRRIPARKVQKPGSPGLAGQKIPGEPQDPRGMGKGNILCPAQSPLRKSRTKRPS